MNTVPFNHADLLATIDAATETLKAEITSTVRAAEARAGTRPTVYSTPAENNAADRAVRAAMLPGQEDRLAAIKSALNFYGHEDSAVRCARNGKASPKAVDIFRGLLVERAQRLQGILAT